MIISNVDVLVVGAGFAGIGMGIQLKRQGTHSFLILERASQVGGTWRDNTYPGVGCDIPSHLYSFSFRMNPQWSSLFASGEEINQYLVQSVVDEQLDSHLLLETELTAANWNDELGLWEIQTNRGSVTAKNLVIACGRLTEPRIPLVPGAKQFAGEWFHSARWRHDVSLEGKRVGIVGSGASAIQIIPQIVPQCSELIVLQRSAPYVVPRNNSIYEEEQKALFQLNTNAMSEVREKQFWQQEEIFTQRLSNSETLVNAKEAALAHLAREVPNKKLRKLLTPNYEYGCKRVLLSDDYYPAVGQDKVTVIPSALKSVNTFTVETVDGTKHELDVLIYATGFFTTKQPFAEIITGRNGESLANYWKSGMRAFASTLVTGYPNMFIIDGPNSALGHNSAVFMIESQIEFVLRCLDRREGEVIDVDLALEDTYIAEIEMRGKQTVWMNGNCTNWYVDRKANRLTVLWPNNAVAFQSMLRSIQLNEILGTTSKRQGSIS